MAVRLLFRISVLLVLTQIIYRVVTKQCTNGGYEVSVFGWMLQKHIYDTMFAERPDACLIACRKDDRCQSFNYVISLSTCEFNNRTKEARPEDFVPNPDRFYFRRDMKRVPLGSIPELPAETCKEIKASEEGQAVSKKYWLSNIKPGVPVLAYCNMTTEECQAALGMQNGAISDGQISASSQYNSNHASTQGRLNFKATSSKAGSWSARQNNVSQWLQVDLGNQPTEITRVATQGRNGYSQWVTKYSLQSSNDGLNFQYYKQQGQNANKEFSGNAEQDTIVYRELNPPIRARYIRFRPTAWHGHISMRVELYGCKATVAASEDRQYLNAKLLIPSAIIFSSQRGASYNLDNKRYIKYLSAVVSWEA